MIYFSSFIFCFILIHFNSRSQPPSPFLPLPLLQIPPSISSSPYSQKRGASFGYHSTLESSPCRSSHILFYWGSNRQSQYWGRGSNVREQRPRQLVFLLSGEPHEHQTACLLQMCDHPFFLWVFLWLHDPSNVLTSFFFNVLTSILHFSLRLPSLCLIFDCGFLHLPPSTARWSLLEGSYAKFLSASTAEYHL